jgi:hypothetical protein
MRQSESWGLLARVLILAGVILAAYPVIAAIAAAQRGPQAWPAAALAAFICWLGATLAMLFTAWVRGPQAAMFSLLAGMLFRMGLPLMAGLLLSRRYAELESAGFFGLVLGFYLVSLVAETVLVLPLVKMNSPVAKA